MTTRLLDLLNRRGKGLAVRLRGGVHPKHLAPVEGHDWYLRWLRSSDTLLDFGCGHGAHTVNARPYVAHARGVDHDPKAIMRARERIGFTSNLVFTKGGAEWLDDCRVPVFTAVMLLDVLEHIADRQRLLREIHRVLTPDGRLLLSVPNTNTTWRRRLRAAGLFDYSDPDHKTEYTRTTLAQELHAAGFCADVASAEPVVYDTPWAGLIDLIGGVHLGLYARLMRWKREMAIAHPEESTGFRVVARKR